MSLVLRQARRLRGIPTCWRYAGKRGSWKNRHEDDARKRAVQKAKSDLRTCKPDVRQKMDQSHIRFFSAGDGSDRTDPILGGVFRFLYHKNLALSGKMTGFSTFGTVRNTEEVSGEVADLHEKKLEAGEALHETKSDLTTETGRGVHKQVGNPGNGARNEVGICGGETAGGLHEKKSEAGETVHEKKSESAAARRRACTKAGRKSGKRCTKRSRNRWSGSPRGLLEGLRRAAAVR